MTITCPHCWQSIDIEDLSQTSESVELVADCEVCCRPIRIIAKWEDEDSGPILEAEPES